MIRTLLGQTIIVVALTIAFGQGGTAVVLAKASKVTSAKSRQANLAQKRRDRFVRKVQKRRHVNQRHHQSRTQPHKRARPKQENGQAGQVARRPHHARHRSNQTAHSPSRTQRQRREQQASLTQQAKDSGPYTAEQDDEPDTPKQEDHDTRTTPRQRCDRYKRPHQEVQHPTTRVREQDDEPRTPKQKGHDTQTTATVTAPAWAGPPHCRRRRRGSTPMRIWL